VLKLIEGTPSEEDEKTLKKQKKQGKFYSNFIDSKILKIRETDMNESRTCKTCKEIMADEGKDGICAPCFIISDKKHVLTYPDEDEEGIQTLY
jgi:hypothetical protein